MFILFLIVLSQNGAGISSSTATFSSEINCIRAIGDIIDMEKKFGVKVQARCVRK